MIKRTKYIDDILKFKNKPVCKHKTRQYNRMADKRLNFMDNCLPQTAVTDA
jgi:hypothetical protein